MASCWSSVSKGGWRESNEGRVALITGASGAIGRAIAVKLASQGAAIAGHYGSNLKGITETARLVAAAGSEARTFKADISDTA